jgi:hypothetical protein
MRPVLELSIIRANFELQFDNAVVSKLNSAMERIAKLGITTAIRGINRSGGRQHYAADDQPRC